MEHESQGSPLEQQAKVKIFSRHLVSATWRLVLGSFLLHVHSEVDALLFMPFIYSRVHCCPETPEPSASLPLPLTPAHRHALPEACGRAPPGRRVTKWPTPIRWTTASTPRSSTPATCPRWTSTAPPGVRTFCPRARPYRDRH